MEKAYTSKSREKLRRMIFVNIIKILRTSISRKTEYIQFYPIALISYS